MSKKSPRFVKLLAATLALVSAASAAASTPSLQVPIDQARPLALRTPAAGVVIGNPSIAQVSLQSAKLLFVTGRAYGTTNLIVVGGNGRPVYESTVSVVPADSPATVIVTRGLTTVRNECAPRCRETPDVADDLVTYMDVSKKVGTHSGLAKGDAN